MISIKHLSQSYGTKDILKDISLDIADGEVVSIIGPSGAGKTSLIRCLNFLNRANSGQIKIDETEITLPNVKRKQIKYFRQNTSMVFQHYALFINKTVLENITEGLILSKGLKKEEAEEKAEKLLDQVGLYERRHDYPKDLSGGQQQRVGIARALALDVSVVLFDEPTSALDPESIGDVLDLIKEIAQQNKEKTIIIVTHEMQFAYEVSDTIVFMEDGQILDSGSPHEILVQPKHPRIAQFLKRVRYTHG